MRINAKFNKTDAGDVSATLILERGSDDPGVISIDGMARSFGSGARIEVTRPFGKHAGKDAEDWTKAAIADIKHQIDEYRTTLPTDYNLEY